MDQNFLHARIIHIKDAAEKSAAATNFLKYIRITTDLVFPRRCPFCDGYAEFGQLLCTTCRKKEKELLIKEPWCMKCGKPIREEKEEYCLACRTGRHLFTRGRSLYEYREFAPSIYRFKYEDRREYAEYFGKQIARYLGPEIRAWKPDVLIPVPLHERKLSERGFNQAELLAVSMGKALNIPVLPRAIMRVSDTLPQKYLDPAERHKNLQNAFKIGISSVKSKKAVLVDDVYTTGSTIDACAEVLLRSEAADVYFITLATGKGI